MIENKPDWMEHADYKNTRDDGSTGLDCGHPGMAGSEI